MCAMSYLILLRRMNPSASKRSTCKLRSISTGEGHFDKSHFFIASSSDGIHWKNFDETPSFGKAGIATERRRCPELRSRQQTVHPEYTASPTCTTWFSTLACHKPIAFSRHTAPEILPCLNKRRIFQTESSDLIHWGEPRLLVGTDEQDNLDDNLYGMSQYRIGDTWIGFLNLLHGVSDMMDVQLTYSLDGRRWRRLRTPWLTTGPEGSWDGLMAEFCVEPIVMGDELWFYYNGNGYGRHDWFSEWYREGVDVPYKDVNKVGYFLGLAKLRLDGFCSLNAGPVRLGVLALRPLYSTGSGVVINAECGKDGFIEAEVMNEKDEVIPGYSRKDFDRFTGSSTKHQLSWRGHKDIPASRHSAG